MLVADGRILHTKLLVHIAYPTEAISMDTVERKAIACMGCARLPMARIVVSAMARWARPGETKIDIFTYTPE